MSAARLWRLLFHLGLCEEVSSSQLFLAKSTSCYFSRLLRLAQPHLFGTTQSYLSLGHSVLARTKHGSVEKSLHARWRNHSSRSNVVVPLLNFQHQAFQVRRQPFDKAIQPAAACWLRPADEQHFHPLLHPKQKGRAQK